MKQKQTVIKVIVTREWDLVPFDPSRIERAIEKAAESANHNDLSFVDEISDVVLDRLVSMVVETEGEKTLTIEDIQDSVEQTLMETGHFHIAKEFIIYRNNRSKLREKAREEVEKKIEKNNLKSSKQTERVKLLVEKK